MCLYKQGSVLYQEDGNGFCLSTVFYHTVDFNSCLFLPLYNWDISVTETPLPLKYKWVDVVTIEPI